ncbi:MAG: SPASM domain-containing protein [Cyclobacteriaceae bacterium]
MFISWVDLFNLASKLTAKRLINIGGVFFSYLYSRIFGSVSINGLPIAVSIEPTTACNLRCPECPSGLRNFSRPTGKLSLNLLKQIINELSPKTSYLTFYFQGEPYLHPDFLSMVQLASNQKMYVATSTNAHFLDDERARKTVESGLDRLIISIDGLTQETYESYRKEGSIKKVLDGTENIIKWKKRLKSATPAVVWQFLVVRPNEHEIGDLCLLAKKYGVDKVALKTAQVYDYQNGNELIPTIDKYSRYHKTNQGTYEIKNKLLDHCWKMWSSAVLTWDGRVVPCCFDKDAQHSMGKIGTNSFKDIWQGNEYQRFRTQLLRGRDQIEMCKNCTEGTKVWA